jgi:hypothetical protein
MRGEKEVGEVEEKKGRGGDEEREGGRGEGGYGGRVEGDTVVNRR